MKNTKTNSKEKRTPKKDPKPKQSKHFVTGLTRIKNDQLGFRFVTLRKEHIGSTIHPFIGMIGLIDYIVNVAKENKKLYPKLSPSNESEREVMKQLW